MKPGVNCRFYLRTEIEENLAYTYTPLDIRGPQGNGRLWLLQPPEVGDGVLLPDYGHFRVLSRDWMYSSFGSDNWPYTEEHAVEVPNLDIIVERWSGPFINQVVDEDVVDEDV